MTKVPISLPLQVSHGVLFLDELPEFKRSVLETMREPLEEGRGTISRAAGTMTFPSQFMLVAAMHPTPDCKMPGESRCSPREIQNYLNRISGPLLDRIDIHRILKVARTIADLAGSDRLTADHLSEAIQYHSLDRQLRA